MNVYGSILPGAATVARLLPEGAAEARRQAAEAKKARRLSPAAKHRLEVVLWCRGNRGNVSRTANHFSHSRTTVRSWLRRYESHDALEERSHRPKTLRQPTWSPEQAQRVLELREQYPRWGKDKLAVLLRREGLTLSVSMVGRILKQLKDSGRLVEPLPLKRARRSTFPRPYALRKPGGYRVSEPGDIVEVDTVDLRPLPGVVLKHFTGRDLVSRWDVLGIYGRATANTASQYLTELVARAPFPIRAIQVDGGSEFKAEFEAACQTRGIQLFILPPRSPKLNGCVERANRTHREEFYDVYDLDWTVAGLRPDLLAWEGVYNTVRPHRSLGFLTPQEYITQWRLSRLRKEVVTSIP